MSRAFTKESTDDLVAGELPERPVPAHANYVTPQGRELLQARVRELQVRHEQLAAQVEDDPGAKHKLREIERDQRYFKAQLEVHFGAAVRIVDENGKKHAFTIVGDDEADVAAGKISWASPLARAMMGAKVGDTVKWRRPAGETEVEIASISYPKKA
jgi:transcription elongation GreA/GreB family factor